MKKLILLLVCLITFVSTGFSQAKYKGEKGVSSIGILGGYAVDNKSFAIGVDYRYNILDQVRLAPSVLYISGNQGLLNIFDLDANTWYANADVHYLARITKETTLYPIVGVGLSVWNFKYFNPLLPVVDEDIQKEETESHVRLGLNLGVGIERRITRDILVGAEFKYNLTEQRAFDQAFLLARVAYYF